MAKTAATGEIDIYFGDDIRVPIGPYRVKGSEKLIDFREYSPMFSEVVTAAGGQVMRFDDEDLLRDVPGYITFVLSKDEFPNIENKTTKFLFDVRGFHKVYGLKTLVQGTFTIHETYSEPN